MDTRMAQKHKTPFTQPETHTQTQCMFILIHKPTQSHTQTVDFRSMPEENQWMVEVGGVGVGEQNRSWQRYIQKGKRPASGTAAEERTGREKGKRRDFAELIDLRAVEEGDISPRCSLMPDAAHLQQLPAHLISTSHITKTNHMWTPTSQQAATSLSCHRDPSSGKFS